MTTHEITIDQQSGTDYAARAFCVCGWVDPEGWHHADRYGAALTALLAAEAGGDAHPADEAEPAPDTRLFQALPIPTTDQAGYAAYVDSDSDEPSWADRSLGDPEAAV